MTVTPYVVVDTRDGFVHWDLGQGPVSFEQATAFANVRNAERIVPSYKVYALVEVEP